MKILITGGTGFLGRHCALRLNDLKHDVTVLGRNAAIGVELEKRGIRFISANLEDKEAIFAACLGQEQVIHAGALNARWGLYNDFYNANVLGTQHVIEACLDHSIERLVYLSTPSLYFNYQDRLEITESAPLPEPQGSYAATKRLADDLINQAMQQGLACISLRPRAIIGPGDRTVLGRLLSMIHNNTLYLPDGGRAIVDLTYIDNAVDAVLLALTASPDALGKTFNITNGEPMALRQVIELLSSSLDIHLTIRSIPFPLAYLLAWGLEFGYGTIARREPPLTRVMVGLMSKSQTLDISAARNLLGYVPKVTLSDGIKQFVDWWKNSEGNDRIEI